MANPPWEELEHTADVALRVTGASLADLFANTALGMFSLVFGDGESPAGDTRQVEVTLQAPDAETLLVDWLTELAYLVEDEGFAASAIQIHQIDDNNLSATVLGGPGGEIQKHVKAVTYHDLSIETTDEGYQVTVVFDV